MAGQGEETFVKGNLDFLKRLLAMKVLEIGEILVYWY